MSAPVRNASLIIGTTLGFVGLAWSEKGLTRLFLFDNDRAAVERRLAKLGTSPATHDVPGWVEELVRDIKAYAGGAPSDFTAVPVDLSGVDAFRLDIYDAARKLGFGETATYGELARRIGHAGMQRETGQALGANPVPLVIPCHRIVAAGGKIGGFSAPGGSATKERMLELEGVSIGPPPARQHAFAF